MKIFKTRMPRSFLISIIIFIINLLVVWGFIFNHQVLAVPWLVICSFNLIIILAIYSGWRRSILMVDERKMIICRPSGWTRQVNFIINIFEINHIEFEKDYILVGRFDSQTAVKFGPLQKSVKLNEYLKQLLPKIVL